VNYVHTHIPADVDAVLIEGAAAFDESGVITPQLRAALRGNEPPAHYLTFTRNAGLSTLSTLREMWRWASTAPGDRGCPS
jgi:hypothetical protein